MSNTFFLAIKSENIPTCYFYSDDFLELIRQTIYRVYSYFRFDHAIYDYHKTRPDTNNSLSTNILIT